MKHSETNKAAVEVMARAVHEALSKVDVMNYLNMPDDTADRIAQAALDALEAAGLAIVPVEPTEAMLEAGDMGLSNAGVDDSTTEDALFCWSAMIAAAKGEG